MDKNEKVSASMLSCDLVPVGQFLVSHMEVSVRPIPSPLASSQPRLVGEVRRTGGLALPESVRLAAHRFSSVFLAEVVGVVVLVAAVVGKGSVPKDLPHRERSMRYRDSLRPCTQ